MKLAITLIPFFLASLSNAQTAVNINIDNIAIVDNTLLFDIMISKNDPADPDIYLANADFIIQFNPDAFSSQTFEKVGAAPGFCDLQPEIPGGLNTFFTQDHYFSSTSTVLENDRLIINLNGPAPNEESIHTRVAKIDTSQHRLGRFMLTGLTDFSQVPDLQCVSSGVIQTKLFNFDILAPFGSEPTIIMPAEAPCHKIVSINLDQLSSANYNADAELSISGSANAGAALTLSAGRSIELLPEFSLAANSSLEINTAGCE